MILLSKLEAYGIRGILLRWFQSYLSNRKQYVALGEAKSPEQTMLCGIPQGSTLGPLLFLVVEQLFVRGQIMQMCHSLRCKLLAENIESLGTSFL